jgi:hypothetical protein
LAPKSGPQRRELIGGPSLQVQGLSVLLIGLLMLLDHKIVVEGALRML